MKKISLIKIGILILVMFIAALVLLSFPKFTHSISETFDLATRVNKEKFTEIYFENSANLDQTIRPNTPYLFSFTIHNVEGKNMDYPYEIFTQENGKTKIYVQKAVKVNNNSFYTVHESFTFGKTFSSTRLVVNLINKNQRLSLLLTK